MNKVEDTEQQGNKPIEVFKIALIVLVLLLLILITVSIVMVTSTNHPGVSII